MTSAAAAMYSQSLLLPMITPTIGSLLSAMFVLVRSRLILNWSHVKQPQV